MRGRPLGQRRCDCGAEFTYTNVNPKQVVCGKTCGAYQARLQAGSRRAEHGRRLARWEALLLKHTAGGKLTRAGLLDFAREVYVDGYDAGYISGRRKPFRDG